MSQFGYTKVEARGGAVAILRPTCIGCGRHHDDVVVEDVVDNPRLTDDERAAWEQNRADARQVLVDSHDRAVELAAGN